MKNPFSIVFTILAQLASISSLFADVHDGDPTKFLRDAYIYQNVLSSAPIVATAHTGEKATVRNTFLYKRDHKSAYDPVNNPNVLWCDITLERSPLVFGTLPLDDGNNSGVALVFDTPTGSFPYPALSPLPTIIHAADLVTVTISPTLSHHIKFQFDTLVRRTGTGDAWESVGGLQEPEFETGKSYNRFLRVPEAMAAGLTSVMSVDMKTVISFQGVEIASREVGGAIVVLPATPPPAPKLELVDVHFNANSDLLATLKGAESGKKYWIESSINLSAWTRRYSIIGSAEDQQLFLPISNQQSQFYRVKAE